MEKKEDWFEHSLQGSVPISKGHMHWVSNPAFAKVIFITSIVHHTNAVLVPTGTLHTLSM